MSYPPVSDKRTNYMFKTISNSKAHNRIKSMCLPKEEEKESFIESIQFSTSLENDERINTSSYAEHHENTMISKGDFKNNNNDVKTIVNGKLVTIEEAAEIVRKKK